MLDLQQRAANLGQRNWSEKIRYHDGFLEPIWLVLDRLCDYWPQKMEQFMVPVAASLLAAARRFPPSSLR
jgi:hypothetical protein